MDQARFHMDWDPTVVEFETDVPMAFLGQGLVTVGWNGVLGNGKGLGRVIIALRALTMNDLYVKHKRSLCLNQKEWLHGSCPSRLMTFLFTLFPQRWKKLAMENKEKLIRDIFQCFLPALANIYVHCNWFYFYLFI